MVLSPKELEELLRTQADQIDTLTEALEKIDGWWSRDQGVRKYGGAPRPDDAIRTAAMIAHDALTAMDRLEGDNDER